MTQLKQHPPAAMLTIAIAGFMVALGMVLLAPSPVLAGQICNTVVNSLADSGTGTLRDAIACATSGSTITFDAALSNQTITLSSGEIAIGTITATKSIIIDAANASGLRIDGGNTARIFRSAGSNASLTLKDIILQRGNSNAEGGAVRASFLILTNTQIVSSTAALDGGGAYASLTVDASNARFEGNQCTGSTCVGGGLYGNALTLRNTVFINNSAVNKGGGAYSNLAAVISGGLFQGNACTANVGDGCYGGAFRANTTATITGTQFISNTSAGTGGAVRANNALAMTNTQFLSNTAAQHGGAIYADDGLSLDTITLQGNTCSGAACNGGGMFALSNVTAQRLIATGNRAANGGAAYFSSFASIQDSQWSGNTCSAVNCLNGTLFAGNDITLTNNTQLAGDAELLGHLANSGTFSATSGTVSFDGSAMQRILGNGNTTFYGLTSNTSGAVRLGQDIKVSNRLTLTKDIETTESYAVWLLATATTTGTADIWGNTYRGHAFSIATPYSFGNPNISVRFGAGSIVPSSMRVTLDKDVPAGLPMSAKRAYYILADGGNYSATLRLAYRDNEITGGAPENGLWLWHNQIGDWDLLGVHARNLNENWVQLSGVRSFSAWGVAADWPVTDLQAVNSSPTWLGYTTTTTASIAAGTNVTYAWDFGDGSAGSVGSLATHFYAALGTYTATLTATNNSSQQVVQTLIEIVDAPIMGLSAGNNSPTRLNDSTAFTAVITHGTHVQYAWDFGDGSALGDGITTTHIYTRAGAFMAIVTATNGTNSMTATTPVSITNIRPVAVPQLHSVAPAYVSRIVELGEASSDPDGHLPLTYEWAQTGGEVITLTDATSSTTLFVAPNTPQVLTFTLVVTDHEGLASLPVTLTVDVQDVPVQGLSAVNDGPHFVGEAVAFTGTTAISSTNVIYEWGFGDDEAGDGITTTHRYEQAGFYEATLVAHNDAGMSAVTTVVTITDVPVADLQLALPAEALADDPVMVTSTISAGTNVTYAWDFGDGSTNDDMAQATGSHRFAQAGVYSVTVYALNTANALSATQVITIQDQTISGLWAKSTGDLTLGQTSLFTSCVVTGTNVGYHWDFGDGELAEGAEVTHVYAMAGIYTVTVNALNTASTATETLVLTISNQAPTAVASVNALSVLVSETVHLDGSASTDSDGHTPLTYGWTQLTGPRVTLQGGDTALPSFTAPVSPTVLTFALVVSDVYGLASAPTVVTVTVSDVAVTGLIIHRVDLSNAATTNGPITFEVMMNTGSNVSLLWDFGDGTLQLTLLIPNQMRIAQQQVSHTYANAGHYIVTVQAINGDGNKLATYSVNVRQVEFFPMIQN